jgi:nucleoside-diphosphate-sugar epimerase
MYAARFGLAATILRPMMTYGPGQKPFKIVPSLILAAIAGRAAPMGSGTRAVDWVYVDDVIDAFVAAVDAPDLPVGPIDLGSGELETIASVAQQIGALIPGSVPPATGVVPDRADEVIRQAETRPAHDLLGWRATTSLGDGLQRTIEAYRLQPPGDDYPEPPSQPAVLPGRLGDAADEAGGHT